MSVASREALPKAGAAGGVGDGRMEGRKGEGAKEMMGETARERRMRCLVLQQQQPHQSPTIHQAMIDDDSLLIILASDVSCVCEQPAIHFPTPISYHLIWG